MKKLLTSLILAVCAAGAFAQNAAPAAPAASAAGKHPCMDAAKAKGLKGDELRKDVEACRADAKKKAESCRAEVKAKKLPREESKAAFKACMGM